MSNLLSLYSDTQKRYYDWLNQTQPKVKNWYDQSGLDEKFGNIQQGLLGTESRQMHPTEGVVTGDRHGGIFGQGGSAGKAIDYAGGKVQDYVSGKASRQMHPEGMVVTGDRPGFRSGKTGLAKDLNQVIDVGAESISKITKLGVKKGNEWLDGKKEPVVNTVYKDKIMQGGKGGNVPQDLNWWQNLSGMFNSKFDLEKAKASWTEKGGFEGLMANPAFTMGLAFMQSAAEGKSLGAGALDNVIKAGGISHTYKKILEDRAGEVTEVTTGQMDSIKSVLGSVGISGPLLRKLKPGNQAESYEQAVEDIAFKVQAKVTAMKKAAKKSGKDIEVGTRLYKKIIKEMMESGEIQSKGGVKIGGYQIIDKTLESKAEGGPVEAGQPYLVGEKGPEVVVPNTDATVVSNDDSQIMSMLLSSNPQLQNVSRTRAESILRSRFPDYFA